MEIKWIKVSTDLFANRKIRLIESMEDRDSIIVIWLKLMILAGEINDGGLIYLTQNIPYTAESLAIQFNRKTEEVQKALSVFEEYGMILIDSDGVIEIVNWDVYQNVDRMEEIREYNRLAKQRSREKQRASMESNICQYCGGKATGYDHIIPKSKGGSDDDSNKVPCCPRCNSGKKNMPLLKFLNGNRDYINIDIVTHNEKLSRYVYYDGASFQPVNDSQIDSQGKCQHRIDKNRKEKNRLDKNREDSKEREIANADPQDLLKMISKKMNKNALYGTDKEVNS